MMDKSFDASAVEARVSALWEAEGAFRAGRPERAGAEPFCMVIPPPNVTGALHMGHALNNTLQDILARYRRMNGFDVLWQPGTDHAGIATQMVVERQLAEAQEPDRRAMGREAFLERVWRWKAESGGAIVEQLKRLGASCDWSRERFTLDEGLSRAVAKVFVQLYREGLVYKDKRLVNWDPKFQTAISDLEVLQVECKGAFKWSRESGEPLNGAALAKVLGRNPNGHLYYFEYPVVDGHGEETGERVTVATTRPETMLGDTAVAVHPEDERYRHLVGRQVRLPLVGRLIAIVADEYSDPEKGTGAVKITPAHDFNDFEVGKRHEAEGARPINVLDAEARVFLKDNLAFFEGVESDHDHARLIAAVDGEDRFVARAAHRRDDGARRPSGADRTARAHGPARRPLERRDRAVAHRSMVRRRQDAGRAGARGGARGPNPVRAEDLGKDLLRLARKHSALVRLASALVGAPDPRLVFALGRALRRGERGRGFRGGARRRGGARGADRGRG